jgi:hypothetical protein
MAVTALDHMDTLVGRGPLPFPSSSSLPHFRHLSASSRLPEQ